MLLPWSASIFLAAAGLRCGFEITKAIMNVRNDLQCHVRETNFYFQRFKVVRPEERGVSSLIDKMFLVDLRRDAQFHVPLDNQTPQKGGGEKRRNIFVANEVWRMCLYLLISILLRQSMTESQLSSMKQYYSINALLSTSINVRN